MKRILVVNTANTGFGGISNVMLNYVMMTADKVSYDLVLAGRVEPRYKQILQQYTEAIFTPPCSRVKQFPLYAHWLTKLMRSKKYDAVHVHGNSGTMYLEMRAAKKAGIPIRIVHSHSSSCKYMQAHKLMKPWMNKLKTTGIACSAKAGQWLFGDDGYVFLPNGIYIDKYRFDPETRKHYRRELGLEDSFVIGHVGYMDWEKNQKYLICAFEKLLTRQENAKLLLIGDGRLREEIEELISQKQLREKILVLGNRTDVAQLYQCMDVMTLPSVFEGLPLTLVEAQTAGLHCIVSDTITKEVDLVGNMEFLPIGPEHLDEWVEAFCRVQGKDRSRFAETMANSMFNIQECSAVLLDLYGVNRND